MNTEKAATNEHLYDPRFQLAFLHPKHWGAWLGIGFAALLALLPWRIRDPIAAFLGRKLGRFSSKARHRATVNLTLCFPDKSEQEREALISDMYASAARVLFAFAELSLRSRKHLQHRTVVYGQEHLEPLLKANKRIIMLVPHCWAIDFPGIYWGSKGLPMVFMVKPQSKNPVYDWLMHLQRKQYGSRIHPRSAGIKPYLRSIKEGYIAYYLPDEDHGLAQSEFTPFFGTQKATFAGLGKLVRLTDSAVVPMMPNYNAQTGKFEIHLHPPIDALPTGNAKQDAELLAQALEDMITPYPDQYMWILRLLTTRPNGEASPYRVR